MESINSPRTLLVFAKKASMIGTLVKLTRKVLVYFSKPGTGSTDTGWLEAGDCVFVIGGKSVHWNETMVLTRIGVLWIPSSALK